MLLVHDGKEGMTVGAWGNQLHNNRGHKTERNDQKLSGLQPLRPSPQSPISRKILLPEVPESPHPALVVQAYKHVQDIPTLTVADSSQQGGLEVLCQEAMFDISYKLSAKDSCAPLLFSYCGILRLGPCFRGL